MKRTVIDIESYYDKPISVKTLGNVNYAKRSHMYMVGIANDEVQDVGTPEYIFERYGSYLQRGDIEPWAANANFDRTWIEQEFGFLANQWNCVLDVGRGNQLPGSLGGLSTTVLGKKMDKTIRDGMQGRLYEMLDPQEQQNLRDYCLADCVEALEILNKMPQLSSVEQKLAMQTRNINYRGVRINVDLVEADRQRLFYVRDRAFRAIPWTVSERPKSAKAFAHYCAKFNIAAPKSLAKNDDAFNLWADQMKIDYPQISAVINAMQTWGHANMLIKKADTLLARVTDDGRLPLDLIYCGAPHTRRWSSRGFNVQNLDRSPVLREWLAQIFPHECVDGVHPGVWTRRWIVPDEGRKFAILDYCQIEPRCLASLAGNHKFLQLIRDGYSPYEAYARKNWNWNAGNLKTEGELLYKGAKAAVLSLGYGCGASKYKGAARAMAGLILDDVESKRQVDEYRKVETETTGFWRANDALIGNAIANKECQDIAIEMPTGEYLHHFDVNTEYAFNERTGRNERSYASYKAKGDATARVFGLWGGVLTENRTQRFARDVLGHAALVPAEEAGFDLGFHAHDEGIWQVDISSAESDYAELKNIMETNPAWCPEVPLEVEGGLYDHYVK